MDIKGLIHEILLDTFIQSKQGPLFFTKTDSIFSPFHQSTVSYEYNYKYLPTY